MEKRQMVILWVTITLASVGAIATAYWYWAKNFVSPDPQKNNRRIKIRTQ